MSTIFYVDLDISVRFRSSYSDFGVLCQMFCSYENWCKIMLRRATKMILGVNRIRILQRIQIYTRKFQSVSHWLSKSEKTCPCLIETSKMSILERISTPRVGLVDTIRFVSKFYTKNIFHDFPENFDLT